MIRTVVGAFLVVVSASAQAEIIESEWTSSAADNTDAELVIVAGTMHAMAPSVASFGRVHRSWNRFQPTLGADWTVEAQVHVDVLLGSVDPLPFVKIGIEVGRPGAENGLAVLNLTVNPGYPAPIDRRVQSGYMLGPSGGRSDIIPVSATDVMLRLAYSVADRSMRAYVKPHGGALVPINTYSIHSWNVTPNELLEMRLYVAPWFVQLAQGQAYIQDVRLVPEPGVSVWLLLPALLLLGRRAAQVGFIYMVR